MNNFERVLLPEFPNERTEAILPREVQKFFEQSENLKYRWDAAIANTDRIIKHIRKYDKICRVTV
jgi:hypothetical protein